MISVILPSYNHSRYLRQRINSVLAQTFEEFEVILLDDCSTDNSKSILEEYRTHPKVSHVVFNEHNSGSTFRQWKKGAELAKGKWIWIAESDDYADLNFLKTSYGQAVNYPEAGIIYCNSASVDENGKHIEPSKAKDLRTENVDSAVFKKDYYETGRNEFSKKLLYYCTIPNVSGVLVKKSLLQKYIDRSLEYKLTGDWLIWSNILSETNVYYIAATLNFFRQHTNNVRTATGRTNLQEREFIKVRKEFDEIIAKIYSKKKDQKKLWRINKYMLGIDLGYIAMYDVRNRSLGRSVYNLIRSTLYAGIQTDFIKGYFYWVTRFLKPIKKGFVA